MIRLLDLFQMSPSEPGFAFQMREEYVLEKKLLLKILPQRGETVALRNFTHNLCMILDSFELGIEQLF